MSGIFTGSCLPPSSSLVSVKRIATASEADIKSSLHKLRGLYCPLRLPIAIKPTPKRRQIPAASTPVPVDSGYVSHDEDEDEEAALEEVIATLRADRFERTFAMRWLTSLISRLEEMDFDDDIRSEMMDDAAFILSSFSDSNNEREEEALTRNFSFPTAQGNGINVTLNDAPLSGSDHTDVGLQSWGASIVLSSMMCAEPKRFGLERNGLPDSANIIELGAGTGLVSLTLAKLCSEFGMSKPRITATDFHPAVLENCEVNIATNSSSCSNDTCSVDTMILDWSQPLPELRRTADMLIASDVVYAPEHAAWLRDCAAHLIKPNGNFWLMVTVRKTGKFEGIPETVEAAFAPALCPRNEAGCFFKILEAERVDKRRGIGRGDETGYNLYRIGWA
ncbi:hypothetical protein ACN47E_002304 [Coniothyrium glycines]